MRNVETKGRSHDASETSGEVLKRVPRKAQQYPAQEKSKAHLEVHVDSDWAGDTVTRRSTTGLIVRHGEHLLRHSSTVQSVIGLSSAESEDWVCRACLQTGTWNYSSRCIQILRVRRQLLREEELARALVTYRQGCYGCKNVQLQNTCEL